MLLKFSHLAHKIPQMLNQNDAGLLFRSNQRYIPFVSLSLLTVETF